MDELEKELKGMRLATPSETLSQRMDQLFAGAPIPRSGFLRRPVPLWQCALVCAIFAAGGFWLQGIFGTPLPNPPAHQTTVYIIQPGPEIPKNVFDATATDGSSNDAPKGAQVREKRTRPRTSGRADNSI